MRFHYSTASCYSSYITHTCKQTAKSLHGCIELKDRYKVVWGTVHPEIPDSNFNDGIEMRPLESLISLFCTGSTQVNVPD